MKPDTAGLKSVAEHDLRSLLERIAGTGPLDIQAARMMIEPYAAATAASNATASDLDAIRETYEAASVATEMERFEKLDGEFHKRIFLAARNDLLASVHEILQVIRAQTAWVEIKRRSFREERRRSYCDDHARIVAALESHDPVEAADAMRAHLASVDRNLFGPRS